MIVGDSPHGSGEMPMAPQADLLPGRRSFYYDKLVTEEKVFLNTDGYPVTTETVKVIGREVQRSVQCTDYAGNCTLFPANTGGYLIEGIDDNQGHMTSIVERDEYGRPFRIVEYELDSTAKLSDYVTAEDADDFEPEPSVWTDFDEIAVGIINAEHERDRYEIYFHYNSENGLLNRLVLDRYQGKNRYRRTSFQNCYNNQGKRTGYIRSELFRNENGIEEEQVAEVTIIYVGSERWQTVEYMAHGDGLIPNTIVEGAGSVPSVGHDSILRRPLPPEDQILYQLVLEPETTTLFEETFADDPEKSITLPSWIPLSARYAIASQRTELTEAATIPPIEKLKGTDILYRSEARLQLPGLTTDEQIADYINRIRAKSIVILQTESLPLMLKVRRISESVGVVGRDTIVESELTDSQKLAAIATLHQAMSRTDVIPADIAITGYDQRTLFVLFETMQYSPKQFQNSVRQFAELFSDDARDAFQYLVGLSNLRRNENEG